MCGNRLQKPNGKEKWERKMGKKGGNLKVRIGICDDETEIREELKTKIGNRIKEQVRGQNSVRIQDQSKDQSIDSYEIVSYRTGEELLADENVPDILFLDIQMPGKNGMEVAKELRKKKKWLILIFITALEEYVFQAFDVGAFHYLVKPISDERFYCILDRAIGEYEENERDGRTNQKEADTERQYMVVKTKGSRIKVFLDTIMYAEVFNRKIVLYTTEGEVEYYGRMTDLQKRLGDDFYRIHRGYLIHFKYVKKYDSANVFLEDDTRIIMAKQQFPGFVKAYLKYNKLKGGEV